MKCVIPAKHIRMLGRVIHTLARIGDYLFIEPLPNNNLALRTLNSSRSSFLSFILNENFFEEYIENMPDEIENTSVEDPENQSKFKVFLRAVVMAFKSISSVDKTVESCTIQTLQKEQKVQITLRCKFSVTKLYSIPCLECESISGLDAQVVRNEFSCQAKVLNAAALNFLKNQEEITMITCQNKFVMKTFMEDTEDISIRTQYTLPSEDFEAYQVESRSNITYSLKDLRALTSFAETFSLPFKAVYEDAGNPITFSIESLDLIQASLVLATMSDESGIDEPSMMSTTSVSNMQQNTSRIGIGATEDLEKTVTTTETAGLPKATSATVRARSGLNSPNSTIHSEHMAPEEEDLNRRSPMLREAGDDLETSFVFGIPQDDNNGDRNESQVENTQISYSPPSKRARFLFKRCFEQTFNPNSIPGAENILAPDSDEELI